MPSAQAEASSLEKGRAVYPQPMKDCFTKNVRNDLRSGQIASQRTLAMTVGGWESKATGRIFRMGNLHRSPFATSQFCSVYWGHVTEGQPDQILERVVACRIAAF